MQGYEIRCAEKIADPLFASALVVGARRAEWLLLSIDCIGLDRRFIRGVRQALSASLSIPAAAITISCSHTHSGPATLPLLGDVAADESYLASLEERVPRVAEQAAAQLEDVDWRIGTALLPENINRRVRRNGRIELGVDPA